VELREKWMLEGALGHYLRNDLKTAGWITGLLKEILSPGEKLLG